MQLGLKEPVEVVGLGASGLSTVRFLNEHGIVPGAMDTRTERPPALDAQGLETSALALGALDAQRLLRAGTIVLSPGLALATPEIAAAVEAGVEVIGDIELFARAVSAPVIAITGSNGKSTVATMLRDMAAHAGLDVRAGGNLAPPALDLVSSQEPDLYVLELSSFQLETTYSLRPAAAVILNLSEDHLDRYTGMPGYISAKLRIFDNARQKFIGEQCLGELARYAVHSGVAPDWQILRERLPRPGPSEVAAPGIEASALEVSGFGASGTRACGIGATETGASENAEYGIGVHSHGEGANERWLLHGDEPLMAVNELAVPGNHNAINALAAWALGAAVGLDAAAMRAALRRFSGLPHRCELVARHDDVRWINDSKGTNVGASVAAIEGLGGEAGIILICGGEGKEADFAPLARAAEQHVREVILLGRDAPLIEASLAASMPRIHAATMGQAVSIAAARARPGDCVLMSPACASFDMFDNYVARGEHFRECVVAMLQGGGC